MSRGLREPGRAPPKSRGGAAWLVDPEDPEALAAALPHALLGDPDRRAERISLGLSQAARFSWRRHVQQVTEVFARVRAEAWRI
jgi:glycosyltransferase involved in cell wall biosynthesis